VSMLSIVMFVLGIVLLNRSRVNIPLMNISAEGSAVRTAGIVLMLPLGVSIVLGILAGMISRGDPQALLDAVASVAFLELIAIISSAAAAYVILKRNEVPFSSDQPSSAPQRRPHPLEAAQPRPVEPVQQQFPRVMTLRDAARYLGVPEQRILDAINNGELAAARGNNGYSIARIVLDEYRDMLQASGSAS
jgi:hypothetical protein